jgi:hypothetical protein
MGVMSHGVPSDISDHTTLISIADPQWRPDYLIALVMAVP